MKSIDIKKYKGSFFKILEQTNLSQIGVMTIEKGGDSGPEDIHEGDQIVYVIEGIAEIQINGESNLLKQGQIITIPAKAQHHIYNKGDNQLFFLTIYTPPAY